MLIDQYLCPSMAVGQFRMPHMMRSGASHTGYRTTHTVCRQAQKVLRRVSPAEVEMYDVGAAPEKVEESTTERRCTFDQRS